MPTSTEANNRRYRQLLYAVRARGGLRVYARAVAVLSRRRRMVSGRAVYDIRSLTRQDGFTLIELAVVVFVMALMLTLAMPYAGVLRDAKLKSVARQLAGRATFLYVQANTQKLVLRLNFDLQANRYFVTWLDPYALKPGFLPYTRPGGEPVMLPAGVKLRDVVVADGKGKRESVVSCNFYPQGFADAAVIHLISSYGRVMTLSLSPLTGRVKIVAGDVPADRLIYAVAAS
jgi:prepilin-type N-terminal cleavage/methylation domain-containing protein